MQKKRNIRLNLTLSDYIVGAVCLLGMSVSLFFFARTLNMTLESNQEPIGVIYFKKNTAQRRLISRNLWERIRVSAPIYNGDRIRTGDLSEAVIILNDSTEIALYENTLVQIFGDGGNSINFDNGSISVISGGDSAKTGETITVKSGDKVFSLAEHTSAVISAPKKSIEDDEKDTIVAVSSGEIYVKPLGENKKNGNNIIKYETIEAGNVVQYEAKVTRTVNVKNVSHVDQDKVLSADKKSVNSINVLMPVPSYTVSQNKNEIKFVPFIWTDENDVRIEFSYNQNFANIINTEYLSSEVHKGSISLDFAKDGDVVYWRVIPAREKFDSSKNYSAGKILVQSSDDKNREMKKAVAAVFGDEKATEITEKVEEKVKIIEKKEEIAMEDVPLTVVKANKKTISDSNLKSETYIPQSIPSVTINDIVNQDYKSKDLIPSENNIAKNTVEDVKESDGEEKKETNEEEKKPVVIESVKPKKVEKKTSIPKIVKTKPSEINHDFVKPVEIKETEIKETESVETIVVVSDSLESEDVVTKPVEIEPTEIKTVEIESVETKAVEVESVTPKVPRFNITKYLPSGEVTEKAEYTPEIKSEEKSELTIETNLELNSIIMPEVNPEVVKVPEIINQTPRLLSPVANRLFSDVDFDDEEPSITFKWAEMTNAQAYRFELLDSSKNVLWASTVRTNKYVLSDKIDLISEDGTYIWTVTAINKEDGEVYSSKTASRRFNISIAPPEAVTSISSKNSVTIE